MDNDNNNTSHNKHTSSTSKQYLREKLEELKDFFNEGLISKTVYESQQSKLLSGSFGSDFIIFFWFVRSVIY